MMIDKKKPKSKPEDVVFTPREYAEDIVKYFNPTGLILEPCKGDGVFMEFLPNADWCEITEGKDFFDYNEKVDWIITNPPYSTFRAFFEHACSVAENIVVLIPIAKHFTSWPIVKSSIDYGGLRHVRYMGRGTNLGFPFGFPVAALWYCRDYKGDISVSYYSKIHQT